MARLTFDANRLNSTIEQSGKEYNLRLMQRSQTVFSTLLNLLPSNYVSAVQGPNYTNALKAVAVELSRLELAIEDVAFDSVPDKDRLQALGGALFFESAAPAIPARPVPSLVASGEATVFGDTVAIASPGPGKRLRILTAEAANLSDIAPVIVGWKDGQSDVKYRRNLEPKGGAMPQDFRPDGWLLAEDTALILNLSSEVRCAYTIDYEVVGLTGERFA